MRMLFAVIGYASVATVLAAALGVGYLYQTEYLSDEKVFHIVAVVQGVDVNEAAVVEGVSQDEIPGEEPSLAEEHHLQELALRNYEAKQFALDRGRTEFDYSLGQLMEQRDRFDAMASELRQRLEEVSDETTEEGVRNVVRDLKVAKPDKGKELLLRMLDRGGADPEAKQAALDEVVQLINAMPQDTWMDILNRFDGAAELDQLHQIQVQQLKGGAKKRVLEEAMQQLSGQAP